ncbi:xanthine dehydrogenase family protein [Microbispora sp. SCL1-1]|uniref:xanthine dehydrogenase family protein molybdopterin-binding subunit n=1 Tax=unclassified Microbispora TaxID=2614687 RepID=UPI00115C1301|nr:MULTISPECIES: xanthine dehydrogenase family protein molybdopterin-binding subunit [unclassified Microbispora]NJP27821.1 xanthine dehydrogenase family protein [Microbispora sp. CL1-1]TQS10588.1 xanthine dehydrogenase family protein [Microbispora sp. SCL1-1]
MSERLTGSGPSERALGARLTRLEDARLLAGAGRFLADVTVPGMTHAHFLRSPHAHARIVSIDTSAARSLPGVHAVLTAAELPHRPLVDSVAVPGLVKTPQPALASDRVRYVGEPVAIVLAGSRAVAEDAAELIRVGYAPLPAATDPLAGQHGRAEPLFEDIPGNVIYAGSRTYGNVDDAFASAAHVVTGRFTTGRFIAAPMETRGCLADYDAAGDRLTVHCSTQSPHLLRRKLAHCLEMGEGRIRVLVPDVGGGFGQKIPAAPEEIAVALAARATGLPVRWVEDRQENITAAPHAKDQIVDMELALSADGAFEAVRARIVGDCGAYSFNSASALIECYLSAGLLPGPYRIRNVAWEVTAVLTNKSPISPYRGVGWTASHSAREVLIDRAARLLGRDPLDLRRQNLVREFPYTSATGMDYDSGSYVESLDKAAGLIGYTGLEERRAAARERGRYLGVGVSPYVEPSGWGTAGALQSSWSFASHDHVRVTMEPSGEVTVAVGTPSQGQGHATVLAQVVAGVLGVDPAMVTVLADDTAAVPISTAGTRASRTATVIGGALTLAARDLRDKLARLAAGLFECDPRDLEFDQGHVRVRGVPARSVPLAELAGRAHFDPAVREHLPEPDLVANRFYDPPATYSNGCVAVVVEVDPLTGDVAVVDAAAVEDCGTMLNPLMVEGQVLGAFVQGVGGALYEHVPYTADGVPLVTSFTDYLLPTAAEIPLVRLGHCCSPSPLTVNGSKGMGESGVIATPAAVACAVADALAPFGVEVDRTPLTPAYVSGLLPRPF